MSHIETCHKYKLSKLHKIKQLTAESSVNLLKICEKFLYMYFAFNSNCFSSNSGISSKVSNVRCFIFNFFDLFQQLFFYYIN